jgi:hypothetical protein
MRMARIAESTVTKAADAGKTFREVLALDFRDIRKLFGGKYNQGLKDLLAYYKANFPALMAK